LRPHPARMGWEEDGTTKILFGVIGLIRCCGACDRQGDVFLHFKLGGRAIMRLETFPEVAAEFLAQTLAATYPALPTVLFANALGKNAKRLCFHFMAANSVMLHCTVLTGDSETESA
jgi:hypothetical protein